MKSNKYFYKNCLTKLVKPIKTYKIIGFDTESHGKINNTMLSGIYDDKYKRFLDKKDFIQYIESIGNKNTIFIATNLGFDFQGIFFNTYFWDKYKLILKNSRTISAKHKDIQMLDTMNYTPVSVKTLGRQIGFEKLNYPQDKIGKVPRTKRQWRHLFEYNSRDCQVSKKWTEIFQEAINSDVFGCELKATISSTSLDLYRRKFIPIDIYKEHFKCKEFIMEAYYGGRVECFRRGKLQKDNRKFPELDIKYFWYDYNSAYPFQMLKEFPLPESAKMTTNGNINTIKKYHGCSDVIVECPYMKYPLLPYRQIDGKLLFPYGKFRGIYNHIELKRAIEIGYKIKKIHKTLYYTKTFYPYKDYINYLYPLRMKFKKENNNIYSDICKLFMNGLYGKMASKENIDIVFIDNKYKTIEEQEALKKTDYYDNMTTTKDLPNGRIIEGYKENKIENDSAYILPILSCCVTSYQRVDLHKDIVKLNALYCDTDSILTETRVNDNMELGGLKLEKEVSKGWLIRPKAYMIYDKTQTILKDNIDIKEFKKDNINAVWIDIRTYEKGWNVKLKGFNKMTSERFYDVLSGKNVEQIKFTKIKESMRRGYKPNRIIKFNKKQKLEDDKRVWNEVFNKNTLQDSTPIYINEIDKNE